MEARLPAQTKVCRQLISRQIAQDNVLILVHATEENLAALNNQIMILIKNYLKINHFGGVLYTLLFSCFYSAQNLSIVNKSNFPIEIIYDSNKETLQSKIEKKINIGNNVSDITLIIKNGSETKKNIPIFLDIDESLEISIDENKSIYFKGGRADLHRYIFQNMKTDLYSNVNEYQKKYQQNNVKGLIGQSELHLNKILQKAQQLNNPANKTLSKNVNEYITNYWLFSIFMSINNMKLGIVEKELLLFYYNNYIKKDVNNFTCNSYEEYDVFRRYAKYSKELGIDLPKYEIIESSEEDSINQFLHKSCQAFYFKAKFNYLNHKKDPKAEKYKKILEKFGINVE